MTPAAILGRIVQVISALPPDVINGIGKVLESIVAGDANGAKAAAEKAAVLAASKASFRETAKRARAAR